MCFLRSRATRGLVALVTQRIQKVARSGDSGAMRAGVGCVLRPGLRRFDEWASTRDGTVAAASVKQSGGNFYVMRPVKSGVGCASCRGVPGFRDT
jgi:hypothetical protein